jgi:hypothetical protein
MTAEPSDPGGSTRRVTRRALVALGAVAALLVALGVGWAAAVEWGRSTADVAVREPGAVRAVAADLEHGDVAVTGGRGGTLVSARVRYLLRRPRLETALRDGELAVGVDCAALSACDARLRIRMPDGAAVRAHTHAGNLLVARAGAVNARADSGTIAVRGASGPVRLRAASGNVVASGLRGPAARAEVESGDIRLAFASPPRAVDVLVASGDATIVVPPGRYRLDVRAGPGGVRTVGVVSDPRATARISVRSPSGGAIVRSR